jgi:hypothetical protein
LTVFDRCIMQQSAQAMHGAKVKPGTFSRWCASDFLWRKESHQRNTQVQFKSAACKVAGIFLRGILAS